MQKKNKRQSRVFALQMLFSMEMIHGEIEKNIPVRMDFNKKASVEIREYADFLVKGVSENITLIDELLKKYCENWAIDRLAIVDLNILRIGIFELMFCCDVPSAVIINEAIEISKFYSSEDSHGFINGVLDSVRKEVRDKVIIKEM
ncbi:transcription antitermination factor NusB [Candidatus Desantisbacteria bacterium CG2_30_40_21]|uniref:Transcription antitermination protein NusB n=4 Tax=unclassified Candidatus Desantisiibacteriota TaxID=3106372 RepID=A0A2M7P0D2_9BACT|nr:MAG: transcription antitermination factor NusB [Candidatus Desantisbacteria bacterium CG2_30_40_21]PIP41433.1 MAG: transcription antitermination factor NusB [Candidatus Desantisbacteria bacterium CG23_combo_of_CG06-09_8_20_14_all_40_23]PIY19111.1 MAG: transcription antitermination factor NusB [Candidatus Desantisbacteria bacterium CG_4_10_14_3_um_filter_40_18]PJB28702.1 MAG: transcription antitermination factor NusB [Candidatus Desantisbacteria bacterium CG_4_9_14_3_um_filter_40_11]